MAHSFSKQLTKTDTVTKQKTGIITSIGLSIAVVAITGSFLSLFSAMIVGGISGIKKSDFTIATLSSVVENLPIVGEFLGLDNPQSVFVVGQYAYVADARSGLEIFDITNPATPKLKGRYWSIDGGIARVVKVVGNYAYLAADDAGFYIIDISDKANPVLAGHYPSYRTRDVCISNNFAYLADLTGLLILDISTPSNPILVGEYSDEANISSSNFMNISCTGNAVFASSDLRVGSVIDENRYYVRYEQAYTPLYVIDVSDPSNPNPISINNEFDGVNTIFTSGNRAYAIVADINIYNNGLEYETTYSLYELDIQDLTHINIVNRVDNIYGDEIFVSDGYLFVASNAVKVFSINNGLNLIATCASPLNAVSGVYYSNNHIYFTENWLKPGSNPGLKMCQFSLSPVAVTFDFEEGQGDKTYGQPGNLEGVISGFKNINNAWASVTGGYSLLSLNSPSAPKTGDQLVTIAKPSSVNNKRTLRFGARISPRANQTARLIMKSTPQNFNNGFHLVVDSNGNTTCYVGTSVGLRAERTTTKNVKFVAGYGYWYDIECRYNADAFNPDDVLQIYVKRVTLARGPLQLGAMQNDEPVGSNLAGGAVRDSISNPLYIGATPTNGQPFNGLVDRVEYGTF